MPSSQVELKVSHLFKAIIDGEKQLEVYRQVLVEQPDFDPHLTFAFLDQSSVGYLSPLCISGFIKEHNIEILEADLLNIFASRSNPQLDFADFLKIILPRASPSLRQLSLFNNTVKTPKRKDPTISYEVKWALARILDKQVNFLKTIQSFRKDISKFGNFSLPLVFDAIDINSTNSLEIDSIYIFLKKNKVYVSENDVMILLRSIDNSEDGKLSYEEFIKIVQPNLIQLQHTVKRAPPQSKSPQRSTTPSKTRSKSPNCNFPALHCKESFTPYMGNRKSSTQKIRPSTSGKHSRANSTLNYSMISAYRDQSMNEYSTIIKVPAAMNTSMGSIGHSASKTQVRQSQSPMKTRSAVKSDTKISQEKTHKRSLSTYKKPERSEIKISEENEMSQEEEKEFASVLREQITLDREIEVMKNELAAQTDFNVTDIFRLFDTEGKGAIDKYELQEGFSLFHVVPSRKELYMLMKRFDRDRDGFLRYEDFYDILMPRQESKNMFNTTQKKISKVLNMKTTFLLRKMMQTMLSNESCSECLRQRLHSRQDFSAYKAFKVLDKRMNGYITVDDFRELLNSYGLYASQKELYGFMGRFDKNHDERVSYNDFVEEIKPRIVEKPRK